MDGEEESMDCYDTIIMTHVHRKRHGATGVWGYI